MKHKRTMLLTSIVALLVATVGAAPPSAAASCGQPTAWVAANMNKLPQTYAGILKFPSSYRRAIITKLPLDVQRSIWSEHIQKTAAEMPLTVAQREFIENSLRNMNTWLVPRTAADPDVNGDAAKKALGQDMAKKLYGQLGPESAEGPGLCVCQVTSDYCDGITICIDTGCIPLSGGCGFLGSYPCNGTCH